MSRDAATVSSFFCYCSRMFKIIISTAFFVSVFSASLTFANSPATTVAHRIRNQCDQMLLVTTPVCLEGVRKQFRFFTARLQQAAAASTPKKNQSAVSLFLVQDAQARISELANFAGSDEILQAELNSTQRVLGALARRLIKWDAKDQKEVPVVFQRIQERLNAISRELGV